MEESDEDVEVEFSDSNFNEQEEELQVAQQILKLIGKDNINAIKQRLSENQILNLNELLDQGTNASAISITCHRGVQSKYSSPIDFILQQKDEVFCMETDFEKIKVAIDVLAQIIGFENLEEMHGAKNDKLPSFQEVMKRTNSNAKVGKLIPKFSSQFQKAKKKNFAEFLQKKEVPEDLNEESETDKELKVQKENFSLQKFTDSLNKKPKQYIPPQ